MLSIGEIIADARVAKGLTLAKVSERTGISESTLSRYESGVIEKIPVCNLLRIGAALDIPASELAGYVGLREDSSRELSKTELELISYCVLGQLDRVNSMPVFSDAKIIAAQKDLRDRLKSLNDKICAMMPED